MSEARSCNFPHFPMDGGHMYIETVFSVVLLSTIFTGIQESSGEMNGFDMIDNGLLLRACLAAHRTLKQGPSFSALFYNIIVQNSPVCSRLVQS